MFRDYAAVTGVLLKNGFRRGRGDRKKKLMMAMVVFLGFLPIVIMVSVAAYQLTPKAIEIGMFMQAIVAVISASQLTIFFFGIFSILGYMFFSDDAEFLGALPVKRSALFMSKLTMVYINELIVSAVVILPTLTIMGISATNAGESISVLYYVLVALAVFLMPLIPLLLVSVLAFPMMYVVSFFKKRAVLSTIVLMILFMCFMGIYMGFFSNFGTSSEQDLDAMAQQFIKTLNSLTNVMFFNVFYSKAMLGIGSFVGNIAVFLVILASCLVITLVISSPLYNRSVMAQMEGESGGAGKGTIAEQQDVYKSLVIKDFKMLIRNPGFAFQSFMGVFIAPLMILLMGKAFQAPTGDDMEKITTIMTTGFIGFMAMVGVATNYVAHVAFTREGKFFYFNKYLPIPYKDIIKGKVMFAMLTTAAGAFLSTITYAIAVRTNFINVLLLGLYIMIMGAGINYMGIYRDLANPKLDWNNMQEAIKQNFNAMVPLFVGMGVGMISMMSGFFVEEIAGEGTFISWLILWIMQFLPAIVLFFIFKQKLDNNYVTMLNKIEI
jgi:ABC-2 type transport system permease protein